jgi:dTDP-4-amino-4,6-dideoxygalactose transaminase
MGSLDGGRLTVLLSPRGVTRRVSFRIHLSPPEVGAGERELLLDAFDSGWIAPLGPHVDAFETELAATTGTDHAVALSSGTAALHLALLLAGVGPGDQVLVPTLTFVATANAVTYVGATPVFVDAGPTDWQIDPELVIHELDRAAAAGTLPAAVITVDLYGHCADHDPIVAACQGYGIPVIEDAAEALGATYRDLPAGSFGTYGVLSFNGNKIITTSGGGALLTHDEASAERARFLATQARDPRPHYEHSTVGYNYRLSNLLAAVGRAQLADLDSKVERRRAINRAYRDALGDLPGLEFMPVAPHGKPNHWLTCVTVDPSKAGTDRDAIRGALARRGIEARPVWKPMHLQPVFAARRAIGGGCARGLFDRGLCLPSGSSLDEGQVGEISSLIADSIRGT